MQTNGDTSSTGHTTGHKYSIPNAATLLGLTEEAVRQRVKRGTLDSVKVGRKLFVLLDKHQPVADHSEPANDTSSNLSQLTTRLENEVEFLRGELQIRANELAEMRRIVAALTSRIPELPSASESSPGSHESVTGTPDTTEATRTAASPVTSTEESENRSWWSRMFGSLS